jgi:hypothetical protein
VTLVSDELNSQRAWWLRTALVLQAPRAVFAALRDESDEAVENRQEPVTALVFLAGIAGVIVAPRFGTLLDDPERDWLIVTLIAVAAGGIYGLIGYWLLGAGLKLASDRLGGTGGARRFRHVVAFALAPLVLSLVVLWPLRLALYGSDVFKTGGPDSGAAGQAFEWAVLAFVAWSLALLVVGIRTVLSLSWARAAALSALGLVLAGAILVLWAALLAAFS